MEDFIGHSEFAEVVEWFPENLTQVHPSYVCACQPYTIQVPAKILSKFNL